MLFAAQDALHSTQAKIENMEVTCCRLGKLQHHANSTNYFKRQLKAKQMLSLMLSNDLNEETGLLTDK